MRYNLITPEKISYHLRTHTFGQTIFALWSVGSTNKFAYTLATQGRKEGTIIIAEEQTRGRGRMNRHWDSQFGKGLWFSIILRPTVHAVKAGLFPYLAGVSVAQAIENKTGFTPSVKWPNDLLLNDKKFCGILSEIEFINNRIHFIILGIGINTDHKMNDFSEVLRHHATSLRIEIGHKIDRVSLFAEIINLLEQHYYYAIEYGFEMIISSWKKRCPLLGKNIRVFLQDHPYYGKFEDLDENGCLLLRSRDGELKKIVAGDLISH